MLVNGIDRVRDGAHLDGAYAMTPGFLCLFSEDDKRSAVLPEMSLFQCRGHGHTSSVA